MSPLWHPVLKMETWYCPAPIARLGTVGISTRGEDWRAGHCDFLLSLDHLLAWIRSVGGILSPRALAVFPPTGRQALRLYNLVPPVSTA